MIERVAEERMQDKFHFTGFLAGDHLKSSSDMGVPIVGVGLLYRQGYFRQYLNAEGVQQEEYVENDWYTMPVSLEKDEYGTPIRASVDLAGETAWFHIWRVDVGRGSIFLLDTNLEDNPAHIRDLTKMLYDPSRAVNNPESSGKHSPVHQ